MLHVSMALTLNTLSEFKRQQKQKQKQKQNTVNSVVVF